MACCHMGSALAGSWSQDMAQEWSSGTRCKMRWVQCRWWLCLCPAPRTPSIHPSLGTCQPSAGTVSSSLVFQLASLSSWGTCVPVPLCKILPESLCPGTPFVACTQKQTAHALRVCGSPTIDTIQQVSSSPRKRQRKREQILSKRNSHSSHSPRRGYTPCLIGSNSGAH